MPLDHKIVCNGPSNQTRAFTLLKNISKFKMFEFAIQVDFGSEEKKFKLIFMENFTYFDFAKDVFLGPFQSKYFYLISSMCG